MFSNELSPPSQFFTIIPAGNKDKLGSDEDDEIEDLSDLSGSDEMEDANTGSHNSV